MLVLPPEPTIDRPDGHELRFTQNDRFRDARRARRVHRDLGRRYCVVARLARLYGCRTYDVRGLYHRSGLRDAEPKPGDRIAVLGIGGLGHVALQFSKALGFETIAITHSPDKHKLATDLGADIVVADGKELLDAGGADVLLVTTNDFDTAEKAIGE